MGELRIRLTPAQASALECAGLDVPLDAGERLLAAAWDGDRLLRVPLAQVEVLDGVLTELANAEDASHEDPALEPVLRAFAGRAARSLTALGDRLLREARSAGWRA